MDFNVGAVGIANALAAQAKAADLVNAANLVASVLTPDIIDDDCDCDYSKSVFEQYADIYAAGEEEIDQIYNYRVATTPLFKNPPTKQEIRDEYTITHPEYALARSFCQGIENKGDKYIEKKMRMYDLYHPFACSEKRQAYYQQLVALYRATHPEYDIIKSAKEDRKNINIIF